MPKLGEYEDLTGRRFGKLTVTGLARVDLVKSKKKNRRYYIWSCKCDCGNTCDVRSESLKSGHTTSCGCYEVEARNLGNHKTHGLSKTRLYRIYTGIKTRCYNEHDSHYSSYGGRGIRMCDEWRDDFKAFYDWALEHGYGQEAETERFSIDRIDVDGDYCPENCRFISMSEQQYNKTTNHMIEYKGEIMQVSKEAKLEGISEKTVFSRIYRGQEPFKDIRKVRRASDPSKYN